MNFEDFNGFVSGVVVQPPDLNATIESKDELVAIIAIGDKLIKVKETDCPLPRGHIIRLKKGEAVKLVFCFPINKWIVVPSHYLEGEAEQYIFNLVNQTQAIIAQTNLIKELANRLNFQPLYRFHGFKAWFVEPSNLFIDAPVDTAKALIEQVIATSGERDRDGKSSIFDLLTIDSVISWGQFSVARIEKKLIEKYLVVPPSLLLIKRSDPNHSIHDEPDYY